MVFSFSVPVTTPVRFESYRIFDASRKEANDAMMALLIGSRLSTHLLAANTGSKILVPDIYPGVTGIHRLNRTVAESQSLLLSAEAQLTEMAIPFLQSRYEVYLKSIVTILQSDGRRALTKSESGRGIPGRHEYVEKTLHVKLDADDVALFDLFRHIRNCIVHDSGRISKRLRDHHGTLSPVALQKWQDYSLRPLNLAGSHLDLESGELVACIAIAQHTAIALNLLLSNNLSSTAWADIIVNDYVRNFPGGIPRDLFQRDRKAEGWNRFNYSALGIDNRLVIGKL